MTPKSPKLSTDRPLMILNYAAIARNPYTYCLLDAHLRVNFVYPKPQKR